MRTKRLLGAAAAILVVVAAATLAYAYWPTTTRKVAAAPQLDDPAVVEAGRYVAVVSDCVACHTAPGGKPFAGGLRMETPVGAIYASNITPDPQTGIGATASTTSTDWFGTACCLTDARPTRRCPIPPTQNSPTKTSRRFTPTS